MSAPSVAIWAASHIAQDELFDAASPANRDDCLAGFRAFRHELEATGGCVHTHDVFMDRGTVPDIVLFLDIPRQPVATLLSVWPGARPWVILQEAAVIVPRNWDVGLHAQFEQLFTWDPRFVDGTRYRRLDLANAMRVPAAEPVPHRQLCTLVSGNKRSSHPLELYSERIRAIRWFERHHPSDFAFFGMGWDRRTFRGPRAVRALASVPGVARTFAPSFPSWRGPVEDKLEALAGFRFTLCYENARDIPGYITEKIFDALSAGAVPVYWGAPDIHEHVPPACFIDRRQFTSYEALYDHLVRVDEAQLEGFRSAAITFLTSPEAEQHSAVHFGSSLASTVLERLGD